MPKKKTTKKGGNWVETGLKFVSNVDKIAKHYKPATKLLDTGYFDKKGWTHKILTGAKDYLAWGKRGMK